MPLVIAGKIILGLFLCLNQFSGFCQTTLEGTVMDRKGNTLIGASVYLKNTLDGTSTDENGKFEFSTTETGSQTLVVSSISYETQEAVIQMGNSTLSFKIHLKDSPTVLGAVVVSAGTMEVNNEQEVAVLSTLDILTTAGAGADIAGAMRTLPGAQQAGAETGLFVRGGDASEAKFVIDGLTVQNPFESDAPGVSQRSRFTPFQFKGVAFSSGGYSARYGQALSSILELNTLDFPDVSTINLGFSFANASFSGSKLWDRTALEGGVNYTNISPFLKLANTNYDFYEAPKGVDGNIRFVAKSGEKGLFKVMALSSKIKGGIRLPDPFTPGAVIPFSTDNENHYSNISYRFLSEKWSFFSTASGSYNIEKFGFGDIPSQNDDWRINWRGEAGFYPSEKFRWLVGSEIQRYSLQNSYDVYKRAFDETLTALFVEGEWRPLNAFAIKPGLRYEGSQLLNKSALAPRLSLAVRTGEKSQVSLAGGVFHQDPDDRYLLSGYTPDFTRSYHYLANYQWSQPNQIFRIEGYYKVYDQLIRELNVDYDPNPYRFVMGQVDNSGTGYASGVDFFWRDRRSVKNLDYWISYSYIDSERSYANYPIQATPDFIADHTLNLTTKYYIEKWKLNINLSYAFATGRPYYNPTEEFLSSSTPNYQNLAFTAAYLTNIGKWFTVFYARLDNIANRKNIFGYRYSPDGNFRYPIEPAIYRSIFLGVFMSLTQFSQDEL
ncbi:MAG: TonB-dependent receptor [Saprospiraceae bacterium]|nr:TonB-dependent receptor [Saprospiraceae bacterium]